MTSSKLVRFSHRCQRVKTSCVAAFPPLSLRHRRWRMLSAPTRPTSCDSGTGQARTKLGQLNGASSQGRSELASYRVQSASVGLHVSLLGARVLQHRSNPLSLINNTEEEGIPSSVTSSADQLSKLPCIAVSPAVHSDDRLQGALRSAQTVLVDPVDPGNNGTSDIYRREGRS